MASDEPAAAGRQALAWVPLAALLVALLLWWSPLHRPLSLALADLLPPAPPSAAALDAVLVFDIDDASLQSLQPLVGGWPLSRQTHAVVLRYLRENGATVVAFNLLFADARDGDAELAEALPGTPPAVLAVAGLAQRSDAPDDSDRGDATPALPLRLPVSAPAFAWPGWTGPDAALAGGGALRLGVISTPLDDDGRLRRMPLLHVNGNQRLPALPVAALLAAEPDSALEHDTAAGAMRLGKRQWPVDDEGRVLLPLTRQPAEVPALPYALLLRAALGDGDDSALRQRIRGRAIFIGSSASGAGGLSPVMTARGAWTGTALQAAAYAALRADEVRAPPPQGSTALLLGVALLPSARTAWRRRTRPRADAAGTVAAFAALLALLLLAAHGFGVHLDVLPALVLLASGAAFTAWAQYRSVQQAQRQAAMARAAAEAASRAKSEFLANVSHEIRTPMNALLGVTDLLRDTPLTPEQQRHVEVFRRAGESLSALINDLLDLAKVEAGRLELQPLPFELRPFLDEQVALLREQAARKGLKLELQLDADLPVAVLGDRLRLGQVLLNLLANAVKFTRRGGVVLQVAADPGDASLLRFAVQDSGPGIAADRLEAIFKPFTQAEAGLGPEHGGTGLGLTISRRLVELMGGSIDVVSAPGTGSTFRFQARLPAVPAALALAVPTPVPDAAPAHDAPPTRPLDILLAEDNPTNVYLVQAMLAGVGHRIDVAGDGEQALMRLRSSLYDLVLMDVQMPRMDGLSATRELRRIEAGSGRRRTPVIALTANAFDDDARASLDAGCDAHLTKPVRKATLLDAVARHGRHGMPAAAPAAALAGDGDAGIDTASALARLGGDRRLYDAALASALPMLSRWRSDIDRALAAGAERDALRLAHDLKGLAATFGAGTLAQSAQRLETALQASQRVAEPLDDVDASLQAVLASMRRHLAGG